MRHSGQRPWRTAVTLSTVLLMFAPCAGAQPSAAPGTNGMALPAAGGCDDTSEPRSAPAWRLPGWRLLWHDEFDGSAINPAYWTHELGDHGWGNRELQDYTARPENAWIANGVLVVQARREARRSRRFSSARLTTRDKFAFRYGRVEARIRIPVGRGLWSAFWLLGSDYPEVGWPQSGEIDVMENVGSRPRHVHGTVHGPGYSGTEGIGAATELTGERRYGDTFHRYAVEWEPDAIRWYVDGERFFTVTPADLPGDWVFDHPFYLIVNLAVGGKWPGNPSRNTRFPQQMHIDYVRVYQRCAGA